MCILFDLNTNIKHTLIDPIFVLFDFRENLTLSSIIAQILEFLFPKKLFHVPAPPTQRQRLWWRSSARSAASAQSPRGPQSSHLPTWTSSHTEKKRWGTLGTHFSRRWQRRDWWPARLLPAAAERRGGRPTCGTNPAPREGGACRGRAACRCWSSAEKTTWRTNEATRTIRRSLSIRRILFFLTCGLGGAPCCT